MDYPVVVRKIDEADGGGYLALVPDLYGCMSDGETLEEAVRNVTAAVADWLEVNAQLGRKVPEPGDAARKAQAREYALIDTIKKFSEQLDGLDTRIERLFDDIEHVKELVENQDAWIRFSKIAGLESNGDEDGPRLS